MLGRRRLEVAFFKGLLGNGLFDVFDCDRFVVDAEHAARFARCRTNATGKLGEVVGAAQDSDRVFPLAVVYGIVEVGDVVAEGATVVAERHAAVHAARSLLFYFLFIERVVYLFIVFDPFFGVARFWHFALELHKSIYLSHVSVA